MNQYMSEDGIKAFRMVTRNGITFAIGFDSKEMQYVAYPEQNEMLRTGEVCRMHETLSGLLSYL